MIKLTDKSFNTEGALKSQITKSYDQLIMREDVGFLHLHKKEDLWLKSAHWGKKFREKFDHLVIIGIGGSSQGTRVIREIFQSEIRSDKKLHFLDNVDPMGFQDFMSKDLDWNRVGWGVVSKSGSTLETLALANFVAQDLLQKDIKLASKSIVICEKKKSPLYEWATNHQIPYLEIPENVGGRFSVLSPVGMFPASFLGLNIEKFRESIEEIQKNHRPLVEELVAQSVLSFSRQEFVTMFWFYSKHMKEFGNWLEQLWAESLGKKTSYSGKKAPQASTPFSCIGTNDQHSLLQQVMDGQKDKFVWFLRFKKVEKIGVPLEESLFDYQNFLKQRSLSEIFLAEAVATRRGMEQVGVSCLELIIDELDEFHIGQMFVLFEMIIGTLGEFHGINAFDQPGVEIGKKLALSSLKNE